jgi:predicted lipid-binding transport protein (Tim44 family)
LNVVKRDIGGWPPGLKIPIGRKSMTKTLTLTSDQLELIVKAAVEAALQSVAPEPKAPVKKKASKKKDPLAPKKTAKPSAPKVDRAARKAQNKVLWRQINGKILKAENAKTEVLALGFL